MSKFLNTLIIGVASGAAAAYFFTTEKGKAVKTRIDEEIASFKEDPKAVSYTHLTLPTKA